MGWWLAELLGLLLLKNVFDVSALSKRLEEKVSFVLLYCFNKFHKNWLGTKDIKKESTNYLEREVLRYFCQSGLTLPSLTLSWTRRLDTRLKSSQERDKNIS